MAKKHVRAPVTPEENGTDAKGQDGEGELAGSSLPSPPKRGPPTKRSECC